MSIHFTKPGWVAAVLIGATLFAAPALRAEQDEAARKVTRKVVPQYPDIAKRWHLAGTVKMTATVAPDGAVKAVKTLGGNAVFVLAAEEAVKQWKYELSTKETTESIALVFKDTQ
jgi:outer membrane biosynthesis protein TonB